MSDETFRTLIIALLGTGGATFVWTVAKSIIAFKNSAEGREDKAVGRLEKFESECRQQLAHERKWVSFWSRRAAVLERVILVKLGPEHLPTPDPEPAPLDMEKNK
jgi:hypothetical protein